MIQAILLSMALLWLALSKPPSYLWPYIAAQAVATWVLFGALLFIPYDSKLYGWLWLLCSEFILYSVVRIAFALYGKSINDAALGLALVPVAFMRNHWIAVVAGCCLVICGIRTRRSKQVAVQGLSPLWIAQGCWQFSYAAYSEMEIFQKLNFVLPTMLCVSSWCWIGRKLRSLN